jgi:coenzyme F420-reducing hydrogenase delta subunit/Pyruvate/2-oxoacid:ferredoxin oxidoreductase delta subunit
MRQQKDGKVRFDFLDELTGETFRLLSDITVVDETIAPSPDLKDLARLFELDTDQVGFLQTDNVHRNSIFSNRKGILIAGPARSIQSMQDQMTDAGNAAITAHGLLNEISVEPIPKAEVMSQRCIRCLTCYRLCPYRAVIKNAQITVAADACEGCGICAAECPRDAIRFQAFGSSELVDQIAAADDISGAAAFVPFLVAFCCSRSAARSRDLATCMGHKIPAGLKIIEVPCSGSVSLRHILTAFSRFADGVLVLTCHKGNCHSEYGNIYAHHRVAELAENLKAMGVEPERLTIETFASNMGLEFAEMTSTFEEKIISLGPNRLKEAAY